MMKFSLALLLLSVLAIGIHGKPNQKKSEEEHDEDMNKCQKFFMAAKDMKPLEAECQKQAEETQKAGKDENKAASCWIECAWKKMKFINDKYEFNEQAFTTMMKNAAKEQGLKENDEMVVAMTNHVKTCEKEVHKVEGGHCGDSFLKAYECLQHYPEECEE